VRAEVERQFAPQRRSHPLDVAFAVDPALVDHLRDRLVGVGLQRAQRQVLEFPLELPDAEPVGERRKEVLHLAGGLLAQVGVTGDEVAQRLRPLGELDQDDADVLDHRQQHLAQALGLRGALAGAPGDREHPDLVHPRDPCDQRGDVVAEARGDVVGVVGVPHVGMRGIGGPEGETVQQPVHG